MHETSIRPVERVGRAASPSFHPEIACSRHGDVVVGSSSSKVPGLGQVDMSEHRSSGNLRSWTTEPLVSV